MLSFRRVTLGDLAIASYLLAALSGVALAVPFDAADAYGSLATLVLVNPAGVLFRNLHFWSGQAAFVLTLLHAWDHLRIGTERRVRLGVWARLVIALALTWGVPRALWLRLALLGSLAGDVFLMLPGLFIPGLVAFLLAHIAYIVRLRQDAPWLASRRALALTLGVGALMYTVLWLGGLPAGLRGPVAAYVVVIALMAAQALGRASVRRDQASVLVAVGACFFMLSDTLLALNRFVTPLPMAQLGVLATYYTAQCLMVGGLIRSRPA